MAYVCVDECLKQSKQQAGKTRLVQVNAPKCARNFNTGATMQLRCAPWKCRLASDANL